MKKVIKAILMFSVLLVMSCSPVINYLGDSYTPSQNIDVFYDEHDIKQEYKVMGMMSNEAGDLEIDDAENVKNAMIKKARSVGADAILFINFYSDRSRNNEGIFDDIRQIYEARVIKYL